MTTAFNPFGTFYVQITDTTDNDARLKIHSAVIKHMSRHGLAPNFDFAPAENSIIAGTKASELVNNTERPERLIIAINYAPPDRPGGTENNHRKDFFCADLGDSVSLCGTSNGLEFSYLKPRIKNLYRLTNTNHLGSQFRSLQVLPQHAVLFNIPERRMDLISSGILEPVTHIDDIVPSVPDITHVIQVDNFRNVKLYLSKAGRRFLENQAVYTRETLFGFQRAAIEINEHADHAFSSLIPQWIDHSELYSGIAAPTLFMPPVGKTVIALNSSSTMDGQSSVPMIATLRDRPAETQPDYQPHLPKVGSRVGFVQLLSTHR